MGGIFFALTQTRNLSYAMKKVTQQKAHCISEIDSLTNLVFGPNKNVDIA